VNEATETHGSAAVLTAPDSAVIDMAGITKRYRKDEQTSTVLAGIDLRLATGQLAALIGPSGCGKSTILKIVSGLIGFDEGSLAVMGAPAQGPRSDVAFMFQGLALLPWRSALQNVLLPAELSQRSIPNAKERARACLGMVGLSGFEHYRPRELSGGMQQRVALARVLMSEAKLLLLDEPLSALDELTRESMDLLFTGICENAGIAGLMVTHSVSEAVLMSDRVFVMSSTPASIVATVEVPMSRPRSSASLDTPEFQATVRQVRKALVLGS
jgi:NitT/TauT family transport system ATP-binding protein